MITVNLEREAIEPLWQDQNDPLTFLFARNGQALDVSNRRFKMVFYDQTGVTVKHTIPGERIRPAAARTDKRVVRLNAADRIALPRSGEYRGYLFEEVDDPDSADVADVLDDALWYFAFRWLLEPPSNGPLAPRELPAILIDFRDTTATIITTPVYEAPMAGEVAALVEQSVNAYLNQNGVLPDPGDLATRLTDGLAF